MSRWYRSLVAGVLCAGAVACSDKLVVENPNNPDQERALARPTDVEALISGSFNTFHRATLGATTLQPQMLVLGMENYSGLANQSMGVRAAIPRPPIANFRGNAVATENYGPFLNLHRAARAASIGLNRVKQPGFTFYPTDARQNARARAFANFVIGVSLGYIAMAYDSGSAVSDTDDLTSNVPLPFLGHQALAAYALERLDSAVASTAAMSTLTVPGTWLSASTTALTPAQFAALARGWAARIRAGVARDTIERAAVDWTKVIADAQAFLAAFPSDFVQLLTPAQGWDQAHISQMYASNSTNWHMMWGYMIYFAANQGPFEAWLASNPRSPLNPMITPDQRFPQGTTRLAQQCQSGSVTGTACTGLPTTPTAFQYIENRANDWSGDASANSQYRHKRFLALNNALRIGNYPSMTAAEIRLLEAEGHLRAGNFGTAATLIDVTRTARGGLPGLVANGVNDNTTPVPGGTACVPRIPVGPSFTVTQCGNMMEALKWEKRMETAYTTWASWWFDSRGWGDMPASSPPHWPVPYQEMDARTQAFYDMPGTSSSPGRYGI
jgi:hypothetical protein